MERFLIAMDCTPGFLKSIDYINRVLKGAVQAQIVLFHVIPAVSPNLLKRDEVQRLERVHEECPALRGYFWKQEDEDQMNRAFDEARRLLLESSFSDTQVRTHFSVESTEIAQVILNNARELGCSTIVMERKRLSRVKELLLGSVTSTLVKLARGITVWVVDY